MSGPGQQTNSANPVSIFKPIKRSLRMTSTETCFTIWPDLSHRRIISRQRETTSEKSVWSAFEGYSENISAHRILDVKHCYWNGKRCRWKRNVLVLDQIWSENKQGKTLFVIILHTNFRFGFIVSNFMWENPLSNYLSATADAHTRFPGTAISHGQVHQ